MGHIFFKLQTQRNRALPSWGGPGLAGGACLPAAKLWATLVTLSGAAHQTNRRKSQHLTCFGERLEGVTEVSGDQLGMYRGPKHQPQLHARPTKLKTHAAGMQTPFEIWNHFKTPGFSACHLAIISLLIRLFKY